MSSPLTEADGDESAAGRSAPGQVLEVSESRLTDVGGLAVHRSLPRHGRRMVGAWCFLDRFGPVGVTPDRTMTVGPHPHIGLHTVTWLLSGEVLHSDSLGNAQSIRPGQLNLMTAGRGIAHAEDGRIQSGGTVDGVQLWVAQPEATRHDAPSFAHHGELPEVDLGTGRGTVLLGTFGASTSPAAIDSPLVAIDIVGSGNLPLPLVPEFEYGICVLEGVVRMTGATVPTDNFLFLGTGRGHVELDFGPQARILLLGGRPFGEEIIMWWNFVARDRNEMEEAVADWDGDNGRFAPVTSSLTRIAAPRPFWRAPASGTTEMR